MFSSIFLCFNLSTNLKLTMALCLVSDFNMFPRSCSSSSGAKSLLSGAWFPEVVINPLENLLAPDFQSPLNLFNMNSNFVMSDVILEISNVVPKIPLESIDLKEIMDFSDSQFDPFKSKSLLKKQKLDVVGVGKKQKKFNDNMRKFQVEWATKLPWVKGLVNEGGFIQSVKCKVCSLIEIS